MTAFVKGTTYRFLPPRWVRTIENIDARVLELWREGRDTYDIAVKLGIPQHQAERELHIALESERRNCEWNWPPEPPAQSGRAT